MITAAQLLAGSTDAETANAFIEYCGTNNPTKRKAREFLRVKQEQDAVAEQRQKEQERQERATRYEKKRNRTPIHKKMDLRGVTAAVNASRKAS